MNSKLVLSIFPGIDLLGRAFEECGFCVVRGPDVLWGGDIRSFHPPAGVFGGVIGGPPCQCFSRLRHLVEHRGYRPRFGNLIPEFERVCEAARPAWWLMENVVESPLPVVEGYAAWSCRLNNRQLGEKQNRLRQWTFGVPGPRYHVLEIDTVALETREWERCAVAYQVNNDGDVKIADPKRRMRHYGYRGTPTFREACRKQGLPEGFDLPGMTVKGKLQAVVNGVPMAMGRAMARAVLEYLDAGDQGLRTACGFSQPLP